MLPKKKANVLIVDDKPEGLLSLEAVLTTSNAPFDVISASSGLEALDRVAEMEFAVILLDVQMPGMDGFETARRIRLTHQYVPIIFITAISHDDIHIFKGYDSGAVDYLFKPLNAAVLQSKVKIFVDLFYKDQAIQEHEQRERARVLQEQNLDNTFRYQNLADAIPHLILRMDKDEHVNYFNEGWVQYTGLKNGQVRENWKSVFNVSDSDDFSAIWKKSQDSARGFEMAARLRRDFDKVERWHLVRAVPEKNRRGEPEGWLISFTDVHDEIETRFILEQKTKDLERSNKDLEQFAYVASHDLQEPLRKIRNYSDLLEIYASDIIDQNAKRYLGTIIDGVKRMQQLIKNLLDFSLVSKPSEAMNEKVNVKHEIEAALEAMDGAKEAKIQIGSLPNVRGNTVQVRQLFQNLLANAVKFRREQPEISVGAEKKDGFWRFYVKDNGIGIPPEHTEKIFVIFNRLHTREKYPGTGIGLAICKKIVEMHGGRIWAESEVGKGTAFYFTLPVLEEAAVVA